MMKKYFTRFCNKMIYFRNRLENLCFNVYEYDQAEFEKIVQNFYPSANGPVRLAIYSIGKGRKNIRRACRVRSNGGRMAHHITGRRRRGRRNGDEACNAGSRRTGRADRLY